MRDRLRIAVLVLACGACPAALPQTSTAQTHPMPSAAEYSASLLPERADVVSWRTLSGVKLVKDNGGMALAFNDDILQLDQRELRVQGFMIPLGMGQEQTHFLVSAVPPSCPFCVPAKAAEIVEVLSKKPVTYGTEPIVVGGKFAVLKHEPSGVVYRMSDAIVIAASGAAAR